MPVNDTEVSSKKRPLLLLLLLVILSISCGFTYAVDLTIAGVKTQILSAIQRDEYIRPHYTYESSIANFARKKQCLRIRHSLHKGERQRSNNHFKWVIDVPVESPISDTVAVKLAELEALVAAKLLSKERVLSKSKSVAKYFDRYRLTEDGWGAHAGGRKDACLYLGRAKHLAVNKVTKVEVPVGIGVKETAYKVTALVGIGDMSELPEWANHPDVRKAFPIIGKLVSGYERQILMENKSGHWQEYLPPYVLKRMKKRSWGKRSKSYFNKNEPKISREEMLKSIPFDDHSHKHLSCISLPGQSSNGVRVDKNFSKYDIRTYKVAIFTNKQRSEWDKIESNTKPYLDRLVSAGLLTSYSQDEIEGVKKEQGKYFSGIIYQLSPNYLHIVDKDRGCIYLGKGSVNVIQLDVLAGNTWDVPFGKESIRFKYIMKFLNPPSWAKDKELQASWSDLKGALEYGLACDGEFQIDLTKKRKFGPGIASCRWAYKSVSEL